MHTGLRRRSRVKPKLPTKDSPAAIRTDGSRSLPNLAAASPANGWPGRVRIGDPHYEIVASGDDLGDVLDQVFRRGLRYGVTYQRIPDPVDHPTGYHAMRFRYTRYEVTPSPVDRSTAVLRPMLRIVIGEIGDETKTVAIAGRLDTGSDVCVLPLAVTRGSPTCMAIRCGSAPGLHRRVAYGPLWGGLSPDPGPPPQDGPLGGCCRVSTTGARTRVSGASPDSSNTST